MKLVIGLGNNGAQYEGTRHNIGFRVLDAFAAKYDASWHEKTKFKASVAELNLEGQQMLLVKPTTFYNLSGEAVRALKDFYKVDDAQILAVHDDIDLPFGTIRLRHEGSDAGNNGIKSLIAHIGEDFTRIRIGVANEHRPNTDAADFVLAQFSHDEKQKLTELIPLTHDLIHEFLAGTASHKSLSA